MRAVATRASRSLRMAMIKTERSLEACGSEGGICASAGEVELEAAAAAGLGLEVSDGEERCRAERRRRSSSPRPAWEQKLM